MKNVFVLPTDKPSRLYLSDYGKELNLSGYPLRNYTTGQHIYITSDEEIKEGDWFYSVRELIEKAIINYPKGEHFGKVILTTDGDLIKNDVQAIDDEFLNWFVKNPSCEEVYIRIFCCGQIDGKCNPQCFRKSYEIIIPKEETKLKNICIKCGVDLYATEGRFECQKHPKECKGIYLSKETLLIHAAEKKQNQHLIDMMKADEELGLYEDPQQHIEFINANIEEFDKAIELFKQETLEEAKQNAWANYEYQEGNLYSTTFNGGFELGVKWIKERICDSEVIQRIRASKSDAEARRIIRTI